MVVVGQRERLVVSAQGQPIGHTNTDHIAPVAKSIDLVSLDIEVSGP